MKKIRSFVVPLLVIPFLASCGSNKKPTQYNVETSVFYNNGGTRETAGAADVKGTPKAGEMISVKLSTSDRKYALPQPVNENLPDAIKLTSDAGSIDYNKVKYTFNSDADANLDFVMPAGNVTLEVEVTLKQQHNISSTINGATSTIKVEGEEASVAYAGDSIEITATVDYDHKFPDNPEKAYALITSEDVTLTQENFDVDMDKREVIISFTMPNKAASVTGELELFDYSVSCNITGIEGSPIIKVNGEPATTACVDDDVEITISVATAYTLPATASEASNLITSDEVNLDENNFEINATNRQVIISFTMPNEAVSVNGTLEMTDFDLSVDDVVGVSQTMITVGGQEVSTAHYGDYVVIGFWVDQTYKMPTTEQEVLNKINSDDVVLTTQNVMFMPDTSPFLIVIDFTMPASDVEFTGTFDPLTFKANALANTSKTYAYHGSVAVTGGPDFSEGSDVTCTITPDTNFNYPDNVEDIKFFSDAEGKTPLTNTPQVTYTPGDETFTFKMPASDVYVAAVCDTTFPSLVVTTNVTHETAPEFTSTTAGNTIEIIFSDIESGYRLPNDLTEFESCHNVEVKGKYSELEWLKKETTGILTIKNVFGNLVITGSPLLK